MAVLTVPLDWIWEKMVQSCTCQTRDGQSLVTHILLIKL